MRFVTQGQENSNGFGNTGAEHISADQTVIELAPRVCRDVPWSLRKMGQCSVLLKYCLAGIKFDYT